MATFSFFSTIILEYEGDCAVIAEERRLSLYMYPSISE